MTTPAQRMNEVLAELERAHAALTLSISNDTWPFTFQRASGELAEHVGRQSISYLAGDMRRDVENGFKTLSDWLALAQLAHDNMRESSSTIAKTTFTAIATNTANDISAAAVKVGGELHTLLVLFIVGIAAYAVLRVTR